MDAQPATSKAPEPEPYDEDDMIGYTIMKYQRDLLTSFEYKVWQAFLVRGKTLHARPGVEQHMRKVLKTLGRKDIDAALALGYATFRRKVVERIMKEHPDKVVLNRCSVCHKIVGTPMARWCKWCKHDWH